MLFVRYAHHTSKKDAFVNFACFQGFANSFKPDETLDNTISPVRRSFETVHIFLKQMLKINLFRKL